MTIRLFCLLSAWCRINDVTTTPEAPPRLGPDAPSWVVQVQREAYPDLAPLVVTASPDEVFARVRAAAGRMPSWKIVASDPAARRLEAVAVTRLLRFRDDIAVEVRPAKGGSSVHVRSRSRLGRGDFGANAGRIRAFLALLVLKD